MTAQDQFNKFVTDGKADSVPVNAELKQEEKTVVNDKGYKTTLMTTGFKLSLPGKYSSIEHTETVEVLEGANVKEVRTSLVRDVANHTWVATKNYLQKLVKMTEEATK